MARTMVLVMMVLMTGVAVVTMMTAMKGRWSNHGEFWGGWKGQSGGMVMITMTRRIRAMMLNMVRIMLLTGGCGCRELECWSRWNRR